MHLHQVFKYTLGYFLLCAVIILITQRRSAHKKKTWLKFFTYFIIVHSLVIAILLWIFEFIAAIIVAAGFYELVKYATTVKISRAAWIIYMFLYGVAVAGFMLLSQERPNEILFVFMIVITFDGFSQITGQAIGRHKLSPNTSPNKTMEGFGGGLFFALITAYFIRSWIAMDAAQAIIWGLIIAISALAGDLAASWYKRKAGIKDFSNLIPGHGGVLDRFDSLIMAGGVCGWLMLWR